MDVGNAFAVWSRPAGSQERGLLKSTGSSQEAEPQTSSLNKFYTTQIRHPKSTAQRNCLIQWIKFAQRKPPFPNPNCPFLFLRFFGLPALSDHIWSVLGLTPGLRCKSSLQNLGERAVELLIRYLSLALNS